MHSTALAHELQQELRLLPAATGPGATPDGRNASLRARMHQCLDGARHEAVGDEEILLDAERRVAAFEVAGMVVVDAMAQREILRACRRPDRIRLHESKPVEGAFERGGREKTAGDSEAAQVGEGDQCARHSAQRCGPPSRFGLVCQLSRPGCARHHGGSGISRKSLRLVRPTQFVQPRVGLRRTRRTKADGFELPSQRLEVCARQSTRRILQANMEDLREVDRGVPGDCERHVSLPLCQPCDADSDERREVEHSGERGHPRLALMLRTEIRNGRI